MEATMDAKNGENISERLNRAHKELNVLYEVSCALRTTLELQHILYITLTGVTSHSGLGYNRAILFLLNPKTKNLDCKMAIGPDSGEHATKIWEYIEKSHQDLEDLIQAEKIPMTTGQSSLYNSLKDLSFPTHTEATEKISLLTAAYQKGKPWHLTSAEIKEFSDDLLFKNFKTNELVIIPLRAKDRVNGIIVADNIYTSKPITDDDIKIFTMLANQAGLAIENSNLYELVVQKSLTDTITNLWNHRFFQEQLSIEVERTQSDNTPLSLAIIDIDDFKKLNDNFGHQHGDVILKKLAEIFKEFSRESDYICRYGGEEFSIILIQTSKEKSFDIAERLRKKIEEYPFPGADPDKPLRITISIGLATIPQDASTKEELIANADKAMYIAKFSGKNKTCAS